jgi:hypothetical protein
MSKAAISSSVVRGRNALRTSGRSIVTFAMPSAVSYRMSLQDPSGPDPSGLGLTGRQSRARRISRVSSM